MHSLNTELKCELNRQNTIRSLAVTDADDTRILWENEVKSRNQCSKKVAELQQSCTNGEDKVVEIKRKYRRLMDVKNDAEQKINDFQENIAIRDKEIVLLKIHLKSYKKKLKETTSPVNQDSLHGHEMIAPSAAAVAHQVAPGAPTHLHSHNNNQFAGQHRQINNNANALSYHQMALPQDSLDSLFSMKENNSIDQETLMKTVRMQFNEQLSQVNKFLSEQAQAREDLDRIREQRENETRLNVDNMRKAFETQVQTLQSRLRDVQLHMESKDMQYLRSQQSAFSHFNLSTSVPPQQAAPPSMLGVYASQVRKNDWLDRSNVNIGPPVTLDVSLQRELDKSIEKHLTKDLLAKKDNRQVYSSLYKNSEYIDGLKRDYTA